MVLYFATVMAKCPLCSRRVAKRHCPAKATKICSVCCGTKREVEIDCPSDCTHLQKGRSYEAARQVQQGAVTPPRQFNQQFLRKHATAITVVAHAVLEERVQTPAMVDQEARDAFEALRATMKTQSSGIYYETLPERSSASMALFRRVQSALEHLMQPQGPAHDALRVSDVPELLEIMIAAAEIHSSGRPRSRQYLDWLAAMVPAPAKDEPSRLIVP